MQPITIAFNDQFRIVTATHLVYCEIKTPLCDIYIFPHQWSDITNPSLATLNIKKYLGAKVGKTAIEIFLTQNGQVWYGVLPTPTGERRFQKFERIMIGSDVIVDNIFLDPQGYLFLINPKQQVRRINFKISETWVAAEVSPILITPSITVHQFLSYGNIGPHIGFWVLGSLDRINFLYWIQDKFDRLICSVNTLSIGSGKVNIKNMGFGNNSCAFVNTHNTAWVYSCGQMEVMPTAVQENVEQVFFVGDIPVFRKSDTKRLYTLGGVPAWTPDYITEAINLEIINLSERIVVLYVQTADRIIILSLERMPSDGLQVVQERDVSWLFTCFPIPRQEMHHLQESTV